MTTAAEEIIEALNRCQQRFIGVDELRNLATIELTTSKISFISSSFNRPTSMPEICTEDGIGICLWDGGTYPTGMHSAQEFLSQKFIKSLVIAGPAEWIENEELKFGKKDIHLVRLYRTGEKKPKARNG